MVAKCDRCGKYFNEEAGHIFTLLHEDHGRGMIIEKRQWCDKCYHLPNGVYYARVKIGYEWR